jgi:hypothetical protein
MPDQDFSRPYPKTFTGVQWRAILIAMRHGLEAMSGEDAEIVRALLPELSRDVKALRELEPLGCGLARGDREDP